MNTTNEQMAEVMGWTRDGNLWQTNTQVMYYREYLGPEYDSDNVWNPVENLNHTALVEARLRELGIVYRYYNTLHAEAMLTGTDTEYLEYIISAGAQTRCNAAWAAYSAWKEGQHAHHP